jgi:hypothetical protein
VAWRPPGHGWVESHELRSPHRKARELVPVGSAGYRRIAARVKSSLWPSSGGGHQDRQLANKTDVPPLGNQRVPQHVRAIPCRECRMDTGRAGPGPDSHLARPPHVCRGSLGVVFELLGQPGDAAAHAEPPDDADDRLGRRFGGRRIRLLQPAGKQRALNVADVQRGREMCTGKRLAPPFRVPLRSPSGPAGQMPHCYGALLTSVGGGQSPRPEPSSKASTAPRRLRRPTS